MPKTRKGRKGRKLVSRKLVSRKLGTRKLGTRKLGTRKRRGGCLDGKCTP